MLEQLEIIRMASAMARHASARHRVVAENVANADTPGYTARDVQPFSHIVNETLQMRATRPGHIGAGGPLQTASLPSVMVDEGVRAAGNGNAVSLGQELVKSVETQGQHRLALTMMQKTHQILRIGLGRVQ